MNCPYCNSENPTEKQAVQYPLRKDKVDIYCSKCGYIYTATKTT